MSDKQDGYKFLPDWRDIVFLTSWDNYGFICNKKLDEKNSQIKIMFDPKGESKMDLRTKVTEIVESLCDSLTSFTSLDVSNRVKQRGFASTRHRDIAHIVRVLYVEGLMEDFGYTQTMIDVTISQNASRATRQAYLYHHQSISAAAYDRRSQVAIPPQSQGDQDDDVVTTCPHSITPPPLPVSPPTVQVVNSSGGSSDASQMRKQKGDCRLEIPAAWVRHLGWDEGSTIYAVHDGDIVLKNSNNVGVNDSVLATATIVDGRLRVPKTAFEKSGSQSYVGCLHEVVLGTDRVIIKND